MVKIKRNASCTVFQRKKNGSMDDIKLSDQIESLIQAVYFCTEDARMNFRLD